MRRNRLLAAAAISAAMVASAAGLAAVRDGYGARSAHAAADALPVQATAGQRRAADADPATLSDVFRTAARRSLPGVVYVGVEQRLADRRSRGQSPDRSRNGSGSGFVFRPDGYILTNNHVIDGAERILVVLQDRREFTAEVVGRDPNTDIAVIRIDATDLPALPLANSDEIDVGDWVVALGYPLSLGSTATAGIVSAKGRTLNILRRNDEVTFPLESFIQTDAAINPGNSGGPLVDLEGRVVGINSAIASPTGFFSGYGFAVPINLARRVAEDLIRYGEPHRPRLGVGVADVEPVDAEVYKLPAVAGAEITQITPGYPAERAGLAMGDVVVAIEGRAIRSSGDLMEQLALFEPGRRVRLDVIRYGEKRTIDVELAEFEPAARASSNPRPEPRTGMQRLGFTATELTAELASAPAFGDPVISAFLQHHVAGEGGRLLVTQVDPSSGAARALLRPGAVIERINGKVVGDARELDRLAAELEPGDAVSMITRVPDAATPAGVQTIVNFRVRG